MDQNSKILNDATEFAEEDIANDEFAEEDIANDEFASDEFTSAEFAEEEFIEEEDELASAEFAGDEFTSAEFAEEEFYEKFVDTPSSSTEISIEQEIFENFNIDFDDDDEFSEFEEDENNNSDYQDTNVLNELKNAGFEIPDQISKEDIEKLLAYKEDYDKLCEDQSSIESYFYEHLTMALAALGSTSATFIKEASTMPEFTATLITATSRDEVNLQQMTISLIHQQIFNLISTGVDVQDITADKIDSSEIINQLQIRSRVMPSMNFAENLDSIISFINTTIPAAINLYQIESASGASEELRRKSTAYNLMKEDYNNVNQLLKSKLQFIKNVKIDTNDNLYIKCEKCGKLHLLDKAPMNVVFFPTEKKSSCEIFPEIIHCECGENLVFTTFGYLQILLTFVNSATVDLKNFLAISKNLCKGASFLRIKPSLQNIVNALRYIIVPLTDSVVTSSNTVKQAKSNYANNASLIVNQTEYRSAIDAFYSHLKGFASKQKREGIKVKNTIYQETIAEKYSDTKLDESLIADCIIPLSTLASYVAHCVGKNYSDVKMLALFSLITFIKEDPILCDVFDYSNSASLQNKIAIIKEAKGDFNTMHEEDYLEFYTIASNNFPEETLKLDLSDKNVLKNFLNANVSKLEDLYIAKEQKYCKLLDELNASIYPLSFCKIINFQVFSLEEIVSIINNKYLFSILDEACDRMIINNYADEFYTYWRSLGIISKQKLTMQLELRSSQVDIWASLSDMLAEFLYSLRINSKYFDYFYLCVDVQTNTHKLISDIYQEIKKCNYYRFCEKVLTLGEHVRLNYDEDFNKLFNESLQKHYYIAQEVCKVPEYKFTLRNQFNETELNDNAELFDSLIFGRYVLKRREGESAQEYVERFKSLYNDSEHSSIDWMDSLEEFNELEGLIYYAAASTIVTQEYHNFRAATFIAVLFFIASKFTESSKDAAKKLGLTEFYLNVINSTLNLWHYEDFMLFDNCELIQALEGYYFSSFNETLPELQKEFSQILIKPTIDVTEIKNLFNITEKFQNAFAKAAQIVKADDSLVDTLEESLLELETFTSKQFIKEVNIVL